MIADCPDEASGWMRSARETSERERLPRILSATARVPDCFWCVAEFFRWSMSPRAADDRFARSCCSCSGNSEIPVGSSVIEIGRPEARPGV